MTSNSAPVSSALPGMREAIVFKPDTPVFFDYMRARGPEGIQFDTWYCNDHLKTLVDAYPIQKLRRYAALSRGGYLAVGELQGLPVGQVPPAAMPAMVDQHERFIGEPLSTQHRRDVGAEVIDAAVVYPAFLRVPEERLAEVGRWYEEEHLPMLLACPQWVMTRRFRIRSPEGLAFTHVALHYLTSLAALRSPERDAARDTPWRDKLIAEGWFSPEYRVCYRLQDF
jgi:hypothetical protein